MNKTTLPIVCNACAKKEQMNIEILTCHNCGKEESIDHSKRGIKNHAENAEKYHGCSDCGHMRVPEEPKSGSEVKYDN
jgi:transcription elongation factor Elf1